MTSSDHPPTHPSPLERPLADFLAAKAAGRAPDPEDYANQLGTDELRRLFLDAVQPVDFAASNLPAAIEPMTVLVDRYELLEPIGSGGMGQVWRARDRKFGKEVAVKVLNRIARAALDLDQLADREGKILAKLSHPGVVAIHDAGRDGEHRFLVMDLVGGKSLDDVIDELRTRQTAGKAITGADLLDVLGPPGPGRQAPVAAADPWPVAATKVFVELLRTLEATHGVGVVHRDLKPGNVRLVGGGAPVLLDFGMGLAAGTDPGKLAAGMFGTAPYAAPEQWDGVDRVGVHTDIYQAGVVLYELLTLQRCFDEKTPTDTMRAICAGRFRKPRASASGVDARLEACVLCAMQLQPVQRYATAGKFREDLERYLGGELPIAAAAQRTKAWRLRAFGRRHRAWLGLAAAALSGAVLVGLFYEATWPQVARTSPGVLTIRVASPSRMLAFQIVRDAAGNCFFAPAPLRRPDSKDPGDFQQRLAAGTAELALDDGSDPARRAASMVSTMFVDETNEADRPAFDRMIQALQQARRIIERRNGEWLSEPEFFELLLSARGSGALELPTAQMRRIGTWRVGGLHGVVVGS